MKLAHLSDLHLSHADARARLRLVHEINAAAVDEIVITGDIGEAHTFESHLAWLAEETQREIRFVLGNHDYYRGSIAGVRAKLKEAPMAGVRSVWLQRGDAHAAWLDRDAWLVGCDGWGDCRHGNVGTTDVDLGDFYFIDELRGLTRDERRAALAGLGEASARHLTQSISLALEEGAKRLVIATHVPPWTGAAWHKGAPSDRDWQPYFTCRAVGDAIEAAARANPGVPFIVLCGHTHGAGYCHPRAGVECWTAGAAYGEPRVAAIVDTDTWTVEVRGGVER